MCVCVCQSACVSECACVRACMRACLRACLCYYININKLSFLTRLVDLEPEGRRSGDRESLSWPPPSLAAVDCYLSKHATCMGVGFLTPNLTNIPVICTSSIHCPLPATSVSIQNACALQWLESRNSNPKTLGSIPWRGSVRNSVSVLPKLCLTHQPPCVLTFFRPGLTSISCVWYRHLVCTIRTKMYAYAKDTISICHIKE